MSKSTESAYFSTGVEGENRLDVLDVTDVGGASAVGGSILVLLLRSLFLLDWEAIWAAARTSSLAST